MMNKIKTRIKTKNKITNKIRKTFNLKAQLLCASALMVLFSILSPVSAQQFDQSYLKWKAEQEAQDAKLKKVDDRYYLSRPSVTNATSKTKASHSSAQSASQTGTKISLNNASVTELQQLNGVGEKKAQAIIEYRQQNGRFKTIDELQNVKGIGPKLLEKNKTRLSL